VKKLNKFAAQPREVVHDLEHRRDLGKSRSEGGLAHPLLVGWVFLSEGIQKFLFPETLGVGRSCATQSMLFALSTIRGRNSVIIEVPEL
jgi:hypothetical protein